MNFTELYKQVELEAARVVRTEYLTKIKLWDSGNKRGCHCGSGYGWVGCLESSSQCG